MKKILILILVLLGIVPTGMFAGRQFSFNKDGKFKIVQFTDIHWMPNSPKCAETTATIQAVLKAENPDFAILTGDVVTYDPALKGWKAIVKIFEDAKMPFTVTMGNHDAEYLTKDVIYDFLMKSPYYVGDKGPKEIMGCGNCAIPVYDSKGKNKVEAVLYSMDSNDYKPVNKYGEYDWIHFDEIEWYRNQSAQFTRNNGGKPVPSLMFFHIPLMEYKNIIGRDTTVGTDGEGIAGADINSGMFASLVDMQDVMGVFVGHDHDNDFVGMEYGITLGFGRVTGADAYGELQRGARIIELREGKPRFNTWVRTPSGREFTYYYPSELTSTEEETMTYLPAKNVNPKEHGVAYTYYEGKCKHTDQIASCKKVKEGTMKNFSIKEAPVEDHFAYDFRTLVKIPEKGVYRFYTFSDDGSRLFIDGQEVVDNDGGHSARRAGGKIALDAGYHELRVLYFEDYMGQALEVSFSGREIMETLLPDDMLYLPK